MKKAKIVFVIFVTLVVLITTLYFLGYLVVKPAGLIVRSEPSASVYLDGVLVGKTPYKEARKSGRVGVRLVPETTNASLISYETQINLVPGIQTVVDREFSTSEDESSGDVITFDKTSSKFASLSVITTPDNSQVWIDNTPQGFSPFSYSSITTGPHTITVKNDGFSDRSVNIKTVAGLKLILYVKLSKTSGLSQNSSNPTPTPKPTSNTYVTIGNTPVGFLRMRTEPGTKGEEIAELKPGQKYPYLETDNESGWYKIQYQEPAPGLPNGITGYVSNQYSSLSTPSALLK